MPFSDIGHATCYSVIDSEQRSSVIVLTKLMTAVPIPWRFRTAPEEDLDKVLNNWIIRSRA